MTMKRMREAAAETETLETANLLMLLLSREDRGEISSTAETTTSSPAPSGRVFECKTCNKQFHSFQALGGHRASHKKLRLMADLLTQSNGSPRKPKKHECPICGLEFALGQALGGHMRRHRPAAPATDDGPEIDDKPAPAKTHNTKINNVPVLKRSNSCSKRIFGLDLNLTPFQNHLHLGKMAPVVDFFM